MDLNKLRYSKTVAVKDMEAHSNKTEKQLFQKKTIHCPSARCLQTTQKVRRP